MKKIIHLLLILVLKTTVVFAQIEQQEIHRFDEFLMFEDNLDDIYAASPCYTNCGGEDLEDFSFPWNSDFETILANERLLEAARKKARREWANRQREIMKGIIEQKLNKTFSNFKTAREALFVQSIHDNVARNIKEPKKKFTDLVNWGKGAEKKYVRNLKLLKIREIEIKTGKTYNSSFGSFQVNGKLLKNIKDLTTLNQYLNQEINKFGNNRATLHVNNYTLKKLNNLGTSFTTEVNKKKTNFYNKFDYDWGKVNFMQFMIIYEDYKRRRDECLMCLSINEWNQISKGLTKFYGVDIAKPDYIRNYALRNRGGGVSVFDGGYVDYMISKHQGYYDEPDFIQDAIYDGYEREQESEKKKVLDEIFNSASFDDLRIQNLIEDLGYDTNSATANWLRSKKDTSLQIANFLVANKISGIINAEAKIFAKQAVEALMNGGEVDFDDRIINKLTNKCAKTIFSELENGIFESHPIKPEVQVTTENFTKLNFSESILKLFDDSTKTDYTIQNGATNGSAATTLGATTTISDNYLSNATKLSIARTMIHESVHAYINALYSNVIQFNSFTFRQKIEEYAKNNGYTIGTNRFHHEFMGQYVNAMAYSLYEWDMRYGSGKGKINITKPDDLLGWDYYYAMAFGGLFYKDSSGNLIETDSFKKLIPNQSDRDKIKQILKNEQNGNSSAKGQKC